MSTSIGASHEETLQGFDGLCNELNMFISKTENYLDILEIGANEFVKDLLKLTKPYSEIHKSGYTHLIDTFTYRRTDKDIEIGWGKYYGPMIENGTIKMKSQPHLRPTFNQNKTKYYSKMLDAFYK